MGKFLRSILSDSKFWMIGGIVLVGVYLWFAFSLFRGGSVFFYTDLGRDFLLMDELLAKKISFIGARTSLQGVFHGPLWLYLNLPAFILTNGDPMQMELFWVGVTVLFLLAVFLMVRNIFDSKAGVIAVVLLSINMILFHHYFTNPIGAFFMLPFFLFTFYKYIEKSNVYFLLAHVLCIGVIIQFEMMIGVPLLLLSGCASLYIIWKQRTWTHIFSFLIILFPLSTFLIFEVRHNFIQTIGIFDYVFGRIDQFPDHKEFSTLLTQRFDLMSRTNLGVFPQGRFDGFNTLAVVIGTIFATRFSLKRKRDVLYLLCFYYFCGYFLLTFVLKDTLLVHYYYPLIIFPIIAFAGLYNKVNRFLYAGTVILALLVGIKLGLSEAYTADRIQENAQEDWQFLRSVTAVPFTQSQEDFGYFVYAPDVFAYQLKYSMVYHSKRVPPFRHIYPLQKQPVTYLIIASPTGTGRELSTREWKTEKVRISKKPIKAFRLNHDYVVEKYYLTPEEIAIAPDFDMQEMIHFR